MRETVNAHVCAKCAVLRLCRSHGRKRAEAAKISYVENKERGKLEKKGEGESEKGGGGKRRRTTT